MSEMSSAVALLHWNLFIDCPRCKKTIDLADFDSDGVFARAIFNNKWDQLSWHEVICPECDDEFKIQSVEY